ncbi:MAG TPA: hypothetical protein VN326_16370 [Casimicrobiaceae bacterium]|jgi:hypothetical protein|nr:hypothetical protein [Casimicrobiaceae bacterium]
MTLNEMPRIMTEAMRASMQLASRRLGPTIEAMSREMPAKLGSARPK